MKNKLSFLKTGTVHVHGARKSSKYGTKMFVRTKPPYGRNREQNVARVKKFLHVSYLRVYNGEEHARLYLTGKLIGLIYAWFRLFIG